MSKPWLAVPHRTEDFIGGCLPACCQMALEFLGIACTQRQIATQIGYIEGAGTPASNVARLSSWRINVQYLPEAKLDDLRRGLEKGNIIIALVRTGELPYWEDDVPHAVVVVGVDTMADIVYVNDPAFEYAPIAVPVGDFTLAWDALGNPCAVIGHISQENAE